MRSVATAGRVFGTLFLGAVIGGIIGELFGLVLPDSVVREFFLRNFEFGFTNPFSIDLNIIAVSFSLLFRMNIVSLIGIGFGYYILRYTR